MWEEPGWTAYALPALQTRFARRPYGLLKASLIMGGLRGLWHLPMVIYGHIPWFDALLFSFALQFIITWLYNRTRGGLQVVMLTHLASNILGGAIMVQLFTGRDRTLYYAIFVATACLVAVLLTARNSWNMGAHDERAAARVGSDR
jgi:hypothetical protein